MTTRNTSNSKKFPLSAVAAAGWIGLWLLCIAAGCGGGDVESPDRAGATAPPPSDVEAWLAFSPARAHMRSLWIDCANVLHFANDPERAHLDSIECAGEDLARKAGRYGALWQQVEEAATATAEAARAEEWGDAAHRYSRIWKACCDCHVEAWPLELRSYTVGILSTWVEGKHVTAEVKWGREYERRLAARPSTPLRERMRRLNDLALGMADQIDSRDAVAVAEAATLINTLAEEGGEIWWEIRDRGKAIQVAAEEGRVRVLESLYRAVRKACIRCHAMSLIEPRPVLDPPEWK